MVNKKNLHNKRKLFLSLFFTLLVALTPQKLKAAAATAPAPNTLISFYFFGTGAKLIISLIVKEALNKADIKDPTLKKMVGRALSTSIMTTFKDVLQAGLRGIGYVPKPFLEAFGAGSKLVYFLDLAYAAVPLAVDIGKSFGIIGTHLLEGVAVPAANIAWEKIINSVTLSQAAGAHDLGYPLRSYHGTQLDCGPTDPLCLQREPLRDCGPTDPFCVHRPPSAHTIKPHLIYGPLLRVGAQVMGIVLGAAFAYLAYEVGKILTTQLTTGLQPFTHEKILNIIEKASQRAGQSGLFDLFRTRILELIEPIIQNIEQSDLEVDERAPFDEEELTKNIDTGLKTQLAVSFAYPVHKPYFGG